MDTKRTLFFELLHKGRELKGRNIEPFIRKAILLGMKWALQEHSDDIKIAANQRDVWANLSGGNVDYRG